MPAIKPLTDVKWAFSASALKTQPTDAIKNYGWSTSNGTLSGTPEKPILQYENGWRDNVYQWVKYLEEKTDETIGIPTTGQGVDYYLKTNGSSVFSWSQIYQVPTTGQTANYFLKTNGSSVFSWSAVREVPADSTSGYFLTMTSSSTYGWTSVVTSGTATSGILVGGGSASLSTAYSNNKIYWYRVGNVVFFSARIVIATATSPTGTLKITQLPYAPAYATSIAISSDWFGSTIDYGFQARIDAGSTQINIYKFISGSTVAAIADQILIGSASSTITNISRTSNVATYTFASAHGFTFGDAIYVSGITVNTTFNGGFIVVSVPTSTTLTVAQVNTDQASLASAAGNARKTSVLWLSGQYIV